MVSCLKDVPYIASFPINFLIKSSAHSFGAPLVVMYQIVRIQDKIQNKTHVFPAMSNLAISRRRGRGDGRVANERMRNTIPEAVRSFAVAFGRTWLLKVANKGGRHQDVTRHPTQTTLYSATTQSSYLFFLHEDDVWGLTRDCVTFLEGRTSGPGPKGSVTLTHSPSEI